MQGSGAVLQVVTYGPRKYAMDSVVSTLVTVSPGGKNRHSSGLFMNTTYKPLMICSLPSSHVWSLPDRSIRSQQSQQGGMTSVPLNEKLQRISWPLKASYATEPTIKKGITLPPGMTILYYQRKLGLLLNEEAEG